MRLLQILKRPPWRTIVPGCSLLLALLAAYFIWHPGLDIRDGRHDRGRNGIWISHAWLGGDEWFKKNGKTNDLQRFRDATRIKELAARLRQHHFPDVSPHLSPGEPDGSLPPVDAA